MKKSRKVDFKKTCFFIEIFEFRALTVSIALKFWLKVTFRAKLTRKTFGDHREKVKVTRDLFMTVDFDHFWRPLEQNWHVRFQSYLA